MNKKLKIIFTLSILLNIILLGLMGGGSYRLFKHFNHRDFQREIASLPEDVRSRIDGAFEQSKAEIRGLFGEAREAKQAVRDALNEETFDPQLYQDAVSKLNEVRYKMLQAQAKKTGLIATELKAEDRRRFAGYLMRGGGKRGDGFDHVLSETEGRHRGDNRPAPPKNPPRSASGHAEPFDPNMLPMPDVE